MVVNPVGYVPLFDGGFPDTFTGRAIAAISGGQICYAGSQAAAVSSGANSVADGDIWIAGGASGADYPVGVAANNAASGGEVTVLQTGIVITTADSAIAPGNRVGVVNGADAVTAIGSADDPVVVLNQKVGHALTGAGSEGYLVLRVNL